MTDIGKKLMQLIRCAVFQDASLDTVPFENMTKDEWTELLSLAARHNVAHIVGDTVLRSQLISDEEKRAKLSQKSVAAIQRYYNLENELKEIRTVLEDANIPYIPLKGSVMRRYYEKPWMRTSCDIDLLVHEEDLEKAVEMLKERLSYSFSEKHSHDIGAVSPSGVNLELHYLLIENTSSTEKKPEDKVWEYAVPEKNGSCCCEMTDEMFYYYHVAHMAKHFKCGGCGIRPFVDLEILKRRGLSRDGKKTEKLLKAGGLSKFAEAMERLAECWFEDASYDGPTYQIEEYILNGGVFGNIENRAIVQQVKRGNKFSYILSRIWLPLREIQGYYPSAERYPFLLPFYEIRRWFSYLTNGRIKNGMHKLAVSLSYTEEQYADTESMLKYLGL